MKENVPKGMKERFEEELCNFMVEYLVICYDYWLQNGMSLATVQDLVESQFIDLVYRRMQSVIDIWNLTYNGPVPLLKEINNEQSVHTTPVVKNTNKGVTLLLKQKVFKGQRTLAEIERAWINKDGVMRTSVLKDMADWGNRGAVMGDKENIYRKVLRGLWAKIKSIDDESLKNEIVQRLWEECFEAVEMCADGHVSRLVNVMVGFDDEFGNTMTQMEYFQQNIALIAASNIPIRFRLEQALRLMDDINMPEDERAAWLEAFD